jgi:uncharacterized protein
MILELPRTENDFEPDPRSFHTLEVQGAKLLFDRATGVTLELNDFAFSLLSAIERNGADYAVKQVVRGYPGVLPSDVYGFLESMRHDGMFRYHPVDRTAQLAYLESLWAHRPYRIQMLMAQGCNLGCRYCYAWRNGSNQKHTLMPWAIARQAVNYLVWKSGDRQDLQITFFGGEPLLNFEVIVQVVQYCRQLEAALGKRFLFELCTNATLLDRNVVDFLVNNRFLLFISIDGWREMHNASRPSISGEDLYDVIVGNAQYAYAEYRRNGLGDPKIRANLTNKFNDMFAVGSYLESLGFTNIDVGAIEPLPHGNPSPSAVTEDQADQLSAQFEAKLVEAFDNISSGNPLGVHVARVVGRTFAPLERVAMGVNCGVGRNTLIVDNKGGLFPCHRYEGMEAYWLGDVHTGLNKDKTFAYYQTLMGHATDHCDDCWIRDYCGGGCAWLLSQKDGHIAEPTLKECRRRRHSVELKLWARSKLRADNPTRFAGGEEVSLTEVFRPPGKATPVHRITPLKILH